MGQYIFVKALTTILLSSLLSAINAVLNHVSVVAVDCVRQCRVRVLSSGGGGDVARSCFIKQFAG